MRSFNVKIASAVVAVLSASSAYALDPAATEGATIKLVIAGASAARDAVEAAINPALSPTSICANDGSYSRYRASGTNSPDFRIYSCIVRNDGPGGNITDSIQGKTIAIRYRSEGGSIYGPGSIAKGVQLKALRTNQTTACAGGPVEYTCTVTGYSLDTDSIGAGGTGQSFLANMTTDVGVADVEPEMFIGANWPNAAESVLGAEPPLSTLQALDAVPVLGQTFGVIVHSASTVTNMSKQDIRSIFMGNYYDWSQVAGSGKTGAIEVCRRERGSGTQTAADIYFNGTNCSSGAYVFVHSTENPPIFGNTVIENSTSSSLGTCVSGRTGGIGIAVGNAAPAGTKFVSIDNVAMTKANAATGSYDYWYEATISTRAGLAGDALTTANVLKRLAANNDTVPTIPSVIALAGLGPVGAENVPVLPLDGTRPVALGRRGTTEGASCFAPAAQNAGP
jgi:ABC-type phosphate transport system substrate-binding protein